MILRRHTPVNTMSARGRKLRDLDAIMRRIVLHRDGHRCMAKVVYRVAVGEHGLGAGHTMTVNVEDRCDKTAYLQSHHIFTRARLSLRYLEDNCVTLCRGCHFSFHQNRTESTEAWVRRNLGDSWWERLNLAYQTRHTVDLKLIEAWLRGKLKHLRG